MTILTALIIFAIIALEVTGFFLALTEVLREITSHEKIDFTYSILMAIVSWLLFSSLLVTLQIASNL
ncbi:gp9 [Corynebacterium phage P1201]|uniref:Gp9 n=1 Tax=Corynebacterium phage P1201 TaxID=384848 RepID=A7IY80_9CAUD|nr:gp9 [Corynebacterium phage P1201]ABF57463.1 gp9 [Corynebacterium phage P1201]